MGDVAIVPSRGDGGSFTFSTDVYTPVENYSGVTHPQLCTHRWTTAGPVPGASATLTLVIHHLNCATLHPLGSFGGRVLPAAMVAHCLLVERADGLLLVDTGFGRDDVATPARLGRVVVGALRPALEPAETAAAQVLALGHRIEDVTDVVVTHLDLDHAGGLADFPGARVHVLEAELAAATRPTVRERARYLSAQWAHGPRWVTHRVEGEEWHGFGAVTALADDVLLVPLHGHTRGHCGVAVRRPVDRGGGWLLHAGDAYFDAGEKETPAHARPGLRLFQRVAGRRRRPAARQPGTTPRAPRGDLGLPGRSGDDLQRPRPHRAGGPAGRVRAAQSPVGSA